MFIFVFHRAGLVQSICSLTTDWTTGVRSLTEAKNIFSSVCVQTNCEAHPVSYLMGTGGPFQLVKAGRDVKLITHPF
jgi:hypothetical protein